MTRTLFFVLIILANVGCELTFKAGPSVLVVGVEGLGLENGSGPLGCDAEFSDSSNFEGVQALCSESVRFSHAFAPSAMSQANLASILTGLLPVDHGVRDNGANFLSARWLTVGEAALRRKYRTLFVSGGPPIWRKSGFAQGFELFDDVVDVGLGQYYRPAGDVFKELRRWLDHEVGTNPFLSVLFLADLQFPWVATKTNEGVVREKSLTAQTEEIAESLDRLILDLRTRRRWNNTNLVLVGLSAAGAGGDVEREPSPVSLKSDGVQVTLLIKPARKERDNVISWAVDRNVSLVDVGRTIFEWLGEAPPASSLGSAGPVSLAAALASPDPDLDADRLIVSETGWPEWRDHAGVRWAVRQNQFLYVHDVKPLIFNTLTDRMELLPLKPTDALWTSLNQEVLALARGFPTFGGVGTGLLETLAHAKSLWREGHVDPHARRSAAWMPWYLRHALGQRDWRELKGRAAEAGDVVAGFVAARQLGEGAPTPRDPCVRLLVPPRGDRRDYRPECQDERALAAWEYARAKTDDERQWAFDRFRRASVTTLIDQDVGRLNYLGDLRWDVDPKLPSAPAAIEYVLTLKEYDALAKRASGGLGGGADKDVRF